MRFAKRAIQMRDESLLEGGEARRAHIYRVTKTETAPNGPEPFHASDAVQFQRDEGLAEVAAGAGFAAAADVARGEAALAFQKSGSALIVASST